MACKLRKAIGAMKDQTSIGLARVSSAAKLEVNILKATSHDEIPMEYRYVNEIVLLVSSNKFYASACAQAIGKRIGKTRNWVVALKSLMLVLRIFQNGDPYFPREIFHAMKRGAKILNLSHFKDDSTPNSWDYTSFIRTFALYLYERLDCFLAGKLQRRFTCYFEGIQKKNLKYGKISNEPGVKGMKPTLVLDRITHWQRLLDRAIGTRPTGAVKKNNLIRISLYAIVQESFDLYRDISDGLSVILDNFFQLPYKACALAFQACAKSSTQFDELSKFYAFCSSFGIGRTSEYPSVQNVSNEVMETLQDFLKDQAASISANKGKPLFPRCDSKLGLLPPLPRDEATEHKPGATSKSSSEQRSKNGPQCSSLEELMIVTTDADLSLQGRSLTNDQTTSSCFDLVILDDFQQVEKCSNQAKAEDQQNALSSNHGSKDCWDLVLAEITKYTQPNEVEKQNSQTRDQEQQKTNRGSSNNGSKDCWDSVFAGIGTTKSEYMTSTNNKLLSNGNGSSILDLLFDQPSSIPQAQYNNPFLENTTSIVPSTAENRKPGFANFFDPSSPTFQETVLMVNNAHNQNPLKVAAAITPISNGHCYNNATELAFHIPSLAPHNANKKNMVSSTFWAQDFDGTKNSSEKTMMTTTNNTRDDDPFEAWFDAMAKNEKTSRELKQEQSLLQQQNKT